MSSPFGVPDHVEDNLHDDGGVILPEFATHLYVSRFNREQVKSKLSEDMRPMNRPSLPQPLQFNNQRNNTQGANTSIIQIQQHSTSLIMHQEDRSQNVQSNLQNNTLH